MKKFHFGKSLSAFAAAAEDERHASEHGQQERGRFRYRSGLQRYVVKGGIGTAPESDSDGLAHQWVARISGSVGNGRLLPHAVAAALEAGERFNRSTSRINGNVCRAVGGKLGAEQTIVIEVSIRPGSPLCVDTSGFAQVKIEPDRVRAG